MKWGETGLLASSYRRNQEIDVGSRRRPGQKTDCIISLWNKPDQELLICEVSGPPNANDLDHFNDDRIKIQKGLKDILNLVAKRAKFGNVEIFRKLRVYGLHFFGRFIITYLIVCHSIASNLHLFLGWNGYVYAMDVSHKNLYRFNQIANFRIPRVPEDHQWMPIMIRMLLSLRVWFLPIRFCL